MRWSAREGRVFSSTICLRRTRSPAFDICARLPETRGMTLSVRSDAARVCARLTGRFAVCARAGVHLAIDGFDGCI